ncbi:hypothetical protein I308_104768 [Cryptococcus tetragattii IND107]|uniref:Proteasome assembly chaperone 3 n=1 Tax=Cryptococcus tetragattii IND107 TaxID=1296105 RepID=A0ABR3BPK7_9TREE
MSSLLEESYSAPPVSITGSQSPPPPIQSYQLRQSVCEVETELLIQTFDDRILVIVTQNGKVGCLTQAFLPQQIPLPPPTIALQSNGHPSNLHILSILPPPPPQASLTPLLGSPPQQTLHELYVSQIATLVWWALQTSGHARRHVVVGLALKQNGNGARNEDSSEEEALVESERERYAGIMDMVSQWPGPE